MRFETKNGITKKHYPNYESKNGEIDQIEQKLFISSNQSYLRRFIGFIHWLQYVVLNQDKNR